MHRGIVIAVAALLLPTSPFAASYGGAEGRNARDERVYIASDSFYELYIIVGEGDGTWSNPFDMNAECPEFSSAVSKGADVSPTFTCPAGRRFPLSGATYRIEFSKAYRPCADEPYLDDTPGVVYVCLAGCDGAQIPKQFNEQPWECG